MKSKLFIIYYVLFIIFYGNINAQNLVPNPGFENQINCPMFPGLVESTYIKNWTSAGGGSTDYYSKCFDTTGNNYVTIPNNIFTFQNTISNNYIGFELFYYNPSIPNIREYAQVKLDSCLKPNKYYKFSIWCNKPNDFVYFTNLQASFTKDSIYNIVGGVIDTTNYSIIITTPTVSDTLNWMEFSIDFHTGTKDSLRYLTLGNFLRDEHTQIDSYATSTLPFPAGRQAYVLIDSVSLIPWHGLGIEDNNVLDDVLIYPNPVSDYLYVDYDKRKTLFYSLIDMSAKLIFDKNILTQTIDVSALDKGMYILEIQDEEANSIRKKVIKE